MAELRYSRDHQWVRAADGRAVVGISEFARGELGEISFVELPAVGRRCAQGEAVCALDSLKSTSEIYCPVAGRVTAVNEELRGEGGGALIDSDPLGKGWLFELEIDQPEQLEALLTAQQYARYLAEG